jgi:PQQ-dependent dehydrogenase (methanol/ethanol family)
VLAAVVAPAAVLLLLRGLPSSPAPSSTQPSPLASAGLARIAPAAAAHPAGEWRIPAGDYASSRYSAMADIDRSNVARLKPAFSFDTGVKRGHEAPPLVIGSTMYIVTPFPNYVYAIDLAQPNHPVKWRFDPKPAKRSQGVACCDVVNRGMSYDRGRLFFATLDGQAIALDANSGRELWRTPIADVTRGETVTMAPLFAAGKVLIGNSGGEFGVRGWLVALDAGSGKEVWRAYTTGPDKDVLIGLGFHPFYAMDRGKDLGMTTWPGETWKTGGGTVWGWISYDPESRTIFYGTSNPGPWNSEQRPGRQQVHRGHLRA